MGVGGAARERGERDEGWDEISQNERTIMAWIRIGFLNKVHSDLDPDSHPQTWPQVYPDLRKTGMQNFAFLLFTV
jgi:hypothetical protein